MNVALNTKRAGKIPTRLYKFNRFYPANKTHCKDKYNLRIVNYFFNFFVFLQTIKKNGANFSTPLRSGRNDARALPHVALRCDGLNC